MRIVYRAFERAGHDAMHARDKQREAPAWTVFSPAVQARVRYTPGRGKEPP